MTEAFKSLTARPRHYTTPSSTISTTTTSTTPPTLITLGGDHSIALASLRAIHALHGPISVLHFDAHLDTWHPTKYPSFWTSPQSAFNHGSMFQAAYNESLLSTTNVHAGIRTRLSGSDYGDYTDDDLQGWSRFTTDDLDDLGGPLPLAKEIIEKLKGKKVYLSFDIDVIEPGLAPGTGTPEPGGWSVREVMRILREVCRELDIVGADVVEVAPAYDGVGETTALAAAQVVFEVVSGVVWRGPPEAVVEESVEEGVDGEERGKDEL